MSRLFVLLCCTLLMPGCSGAPNRSAFAIHAPAESVQALTALTSGVGYPITVTSDGRGGYGLEVRVVNDLPECTECYRINEDHERYVIHTGGLLGAQYGVTALLEAYGFRFFSPGPDARAGLFDRFEPRVASAHPSPH